MSEEDINRIIDWLEALSSKEGYAEARQFRRDIIDFMGPNGVSWEGLSDTIIAEGTSTWLGRPRGGGMALPALPPSHLGPCVSRIRIALSQHATDINRPATLSVEEFGDGLQAIWAVLRGPDESEDNSTPQTNGKTIQSDFKLTR